MRTMLKALLALLYLLLNVYAQAASEFRANETGNNLQVTSPYGSKLYLGDMGFDALGNYQMEIPLKDLRPSAMGMGSGGGQDGGQASGSPKEKAAGTDDVDQLVLEANKLYNRGKFTEAMSYVEEILRRDPSHVRAWIMKGSLMHVLGQKEMARKAWTQALRLDPANPKIKNFLENYR